MTRDANIRRFAVVAVAVVLLLSAPTPGHAQSFISPLIGFNFGGDANCPELRGCEDKRLNWGGSLGRMGNVFGVEEELAFAKDFFGESEDFDSNVMTLMTNVMFVPNLGPIRPYALAGVGLMRTSFEVTATGVKTHNNDAAWDVGGGLMILFAPHVGIRGDVRYFHAFKDLQVLGFSIGDTKLDFGRASGALVFTF